MICLDSIEVAMQYMRRTSLAWGLAAPLVHQVDDHRPPHNCLTKCTTANSIKGLTRFLSTAG